MNKPQISITDNGFVTADFGWVLAFSDGDICGPKSFVNVQQAEEIVEQFQAAITWVKENVITDPVIHAAGAVPPFADPSE